MIYAFNNVLVKKDGDPVFHFDEEQTSTMTHLIQSLQDHHPIEAVANRVIEALHSFYIPLDLDRSVYDTFAEPLVTFIALQCLTEEGSPRQLPDIPSLCSRVQFSMRLRGYHYLWRTALDAKIIKPKDLPINLTGNNSKPAASVKVRRTPSQASTKQDTHPHSTKHLASTHVRSQRRQQGTMLQEDSDVADDDDDDDDDDYIASLPRNPHGSRISKTSTPSTSGPKMKSDPSVKTMEIGDAPKVRQRSTWWEYVFSNNFCVVTQA